MHVGLFLCGGISSGKCVVNQTPTPSITTTMTLFRRQGTVLSSRSNLTITGISDLTPPMPILLATSDIDAYKSVLSWLLDYSAAKIPPSSSVLEIF